MRCKTCFVTFNTQSHKCVYVLVEECKKYISYIFEELEDDGYDRKVIIETMKSLIYRKRMDIKENSKKHLNDIFHKLARDGFTDDDIAYTLLKVMEYC